MDDVLDSTWARGCFGIIGFAVAGGALTTLVMILIVGTGGGELELAGTVGASICLTCTALASGALCAYGIEGLLAERTVGRRIEDEILGVARDHGGTVTVAQIAGDTRLTLEESRAVLDDLAREGLVRMHVDDRGTEQYQFSGLDELGDGEARTSFERTLQRARERTGQIDESTEHEERSQTELEAANPNQHAPPRRNSDTCDD